MSEYANAVAVAISDHLDGANTHLTAGHLLWVRIGKAMEELGEAVTELVALEGSNPRKGAPDPDARARLAHELLDVATTALYAYIHVTNDPQPLTALDHHILAQGQRVGIVKGERFPR